MKNNKVKGEITVEPEYIGGVRMGSSKVERNEKDVKDVWVYFTLGKGYDLQYYGCTLEIECDPSGGG